jgi:hypothetical protein
MRMLGRKRGRRRAPCRHIRAFPRFGAIRGVLGLTADALAAINPALWPIVVSVDLLVYIVLISRLPRYHLDLWLDERNVMH